MKFVVHNRAAWTIVTPTRKSRDAILASHKNDRNRNTKDILDICVRVRYYLGGSRERNMNMISQ